MNLLRRKRKMIMEKKKKMMMMMRMRRKSNGMKKERMKWMISMILMILMECILMIGQLWLRGLRLNSYNWS